MKYLSPEKMIVNAMYALSHRTVPKTDDDGSIEFETEERRLFLGLFPRSVTTMEIRDSLTKGELWSSVLTFDGFAKGEGVISSVPRTITRGIVYDNVGEFIEVLKSGLRYEDLLDGYEMAEANDVQV